VVVEMKSRKRGIAINGEMLSQLMAQRGLQADELAQLAGVAEDTVSRARHGLRIERNSLRKLTDALLRVPTNPLMSELTKKTPSGLASDGVSGEVSRASGEPR
jgi:transcriptional regulator with XRE-family HTH domain